MSMDFIKIRITVISFFIVCSIDILAQNRLSPLDANRQIRMDGISNGILDKNASFAYLSISKTNRVYGFYYNDSTEKLIYAESQTPLKYFMNKTFRIKEIHLIKEELAIPDTLADLLDKMYLYSIVASSYSYLPDNEENVIYYFKHDRMSAFCYVPQNGTVNEHLIKISEQICHDIKEHNIENICAMASYAHKLISSYYDLNPKDVNYALLYNHLLSIKYNNWNFDFNDYQAKRELILALYQKNTF